MLLDSTAFIDFTRGYKPAVDAFEKVLFGQSTSVATKMELVVGRATKREIKDVDNLFKDLQITVVPLSETVSITAEEILIKFYHSNGIGILDSFIAATALTNNEELVTRNKRHFDFIPNLKIITPY